MCLVSIFTALPLKCDAHGCPPLLLANASLLSCRKRLNCAAISACSPTEFLTHISTHIPLLAASFMQPAQYQSKTGSICLKLRMSRLLMLFPPKSSLWSLQRRICSRRRGRNGCYDPAAAYGGAHWLPESGSTSPRYDYLPHTSRNSDVQPSSPPCARGWH